MQIVKRRPWLSCGWLWNADDLAEGFYLLFSCLAGFSTTATLVVILLLRAQRYVLFSSFLHRTKRHCFSMRNTLYIQSQGRRKEKKKKEKNVRQTRLIETTKHFASLSNLSFSFTHYCQQTRRRRRRKNQLKCQRGQVTKRHCACWMEFLPKNRTEGSSRFRVQVFSVRWVVRHGWLLFGDTTTCRVIVAIRLWNDHRCRWSETRRQFIGCFDRSKWMIHVMLLVGERSREFRFSLDTIDRKEWGSGFAVRP